MKCLKCILRELCGMCPVNGELECGNPQQPLDFLCRLAHLCAYALGMAVAAHGNCEYCPGGPIHGEIRQMAERLKVKSNESKGK